MRFALDTPPVLPFPSAIRFAFLGDLLIAALALTGFVLGWESTFLKVGEESNLPTWYSTIQLALIALVLGLIVTRDLRVGNPSTWPLVLPPGLFALLSLDEAAMVHERLGDWLLATWGMGEGLRTGPWMFFYAPFIGILVLATARTLWPYIQGRWYVLVLLVLGLCWLGVSAVGLEVLANMTQEHSLAQKGLGFFEEIGELIGATLLLWGSVVLLDHEGIHLEWGTMRA